jgi:predicted porin
MRFKLSLIGLLVAAATGSHAQDVTLFGIVDLATEHINNVAPSGGGLTRVPSLTGTVSSRLGLRGVEDLGGGLRAVFTLEEGFAPDQGSLLQGGRGWGRQAFVGLAGHWGSLTFGRQYTMLFWSVLDADVLGPNLYGSGSLDSYIPNARIDNSFSYRGTFNGLTVGATYSLGRDAVNAGPSPSGTNCGGESTDRKACIERSALVKYDGPAWGAAVAVDQMRGGPGAFAGLTSSALLDSRVSLNGYANIGKLKLAGGLIRRHNDADAITPKSDLVYAGAVYAVSPDFTLDGEVLRLAFKGNGNRATLAAARATYSFSKRTAVYGMLGHIANEGALALAVSAGAAGGNPVAGGSQLALATGIRHAF